MIAQSGDLGVSGYVAQSFAEGAIGYVNYSYSLGAQFPVAKVLNAAGYYTEPTPENVAVSLLKAKINTDAGLRRVPDPAARRRLHRPRQAQLPAVVVLVLHPPDQGQGPVQRRRRAGPSAPSPTTPCARPSSSRRRSATRRCRSTWCRPASSRSARSPAWSSRTSTSRPARTRPSRPTAPTCWPRTRPRPRSATRRARRSARTGTGGVRSVTTPVNTARPAQGSGAAATLGGRLRHGRRQQRDVRSGRRALGRHRGGRGRRSDRRHGRCRRTRSVRGARLGRHGRRCGLRCRHWRVRRGPRGGEPANGSEPDGRTGGRRPPPCWPALRVEPVRWAWSSSSYF